MSEITNAKLSWVIALSFVAIETETISFYLEIGIADCDSHKTPEFYVIENRTRLVFLYT